MPTRFELGHQSGRHLFFVLPNGSPDPQARVDVYDGPSPEGATVVLLWMPPFSPL